jgi:hypothetical protein
MIPVGRDVLSKFELTKGSGAIPLLTSIFLAELL